MVFAGDVASVEIAYQDFANARRALAGPEWPPAGRATEAMFHHAKTFVCAVRRVARMCEVLMALELPETPRKALKLAYRKRKALLDSYIKPRDAIEHADVDNGRRGSLVLLTNLVGDTLWVTGDRTHSATINESIVNAVVALRDEVLQAVGSAIGRRGAAQQGVAADEPR